VIVRNAAEADLDRLAMIWHQGWHAAHASLVPVELTRLRTLLNFRERLKAALPDVRVAGPPVAPLGSTSSMTTSFFNSTFPPRLAAPVSLLA